VDYKKAVPLDKETAALNVHLEASTATFEMKEHHSSIESARQVVEPYARSWEIYAGIQDGPEAISFVFEDGDVLDRDPAPSSGAVIEAKPAHFAFQVHPVSLHIGRNDYPQPPDGFEVSSQVDKMYYQYVLYREGKLTLGPMANLILTVLEESAGSSSKRKQAANDYKIEYAVLRKLGELTATKGGKEARKSEGLTREFTPDERRWIEEAVRVIIRRTGECASNPSRPHEVITMTSLPLL
jgi:hypothetical protein